MIHSRQASVEADRAPGTVSGWEGLRPAAASALFSWNLHPVQRERKEEGSFQAGEWGCSREKMRPERAHGREVLT